MRMVPAKSPRLLACGVILLALLTVGCVPQGPAERAATRDAHLHFDPPKKAEKPAFKGIELYSWKGRDGRWRFSLLYGTNRLKPRTMVTDERFALTSLKALKAKVRLLAKGEMLLWIALPSEDGEPKVIHPPQHVIDDMAKYCRELAVDLHVVRR